MDVFQECVRDAAAVVAEGREVLYRWPLDAAAERCRRPGESLADARARVEEARRPLSAEEWADLNAFDEDGVPLEAVAS